MAGKHGSLRDDGLVVVRNRGRAVIVAFGAVIVQRAALCPWRMGIAGLLPALQSISKSVNLKSYKGKVVAVDACCWMHRSTYVCAEELVEGKATDKYIDFMLSMVTLLTSNEITPILVFDGASLPMKAVTNSKRREIREKSMYEFVMKRITLTNVCVLTAEMAVVLL